MIRPDPKNKPNIFRPLYFDELSNLSERDFIKDHHKYECFIKHVGSEGNLYIAVYLMPESSKDERREKTRDRAVSHIGI